MAGETDAFGGEPVQVRGLRTAIPGGAEDIPCVIVGEEEEQVRLPVAGAGDT